jgi:hypothetical protein
MRLTGLLGFAMALLAAAPAQAAISDCKAVQINEKPTAPVVALTKKPRILKHAVVFRPRCSELCHVRVTLRRGHRHVSVTEVFSGRRAIRVPKPSGHGKLHYTVVARDEAGNRSKVTRGRL